MNLFTLQQKSRMLAVLNNAPYNALQNSTACQASSAGNDAGISAIISPGITLCGGTFTPQVTIRNYGTNTLTSATISYRVDMGPIQTYNWTGSLTTNSTANVTLSSMTTTAGTHTFSAYTTNPNSSTDANAGNDQSQRTFTVSSTGQNLPYTQGFESTTFPPSGCTINNPDAATTWARTTAAASSGVASAYMDNANYAANGEVDEIVLPNFNLSSVANPVMTFELAYQLYTDPNASTPFSDTLRVWISTDCGVTWTQIYGKWSSNLTTTTPTFSTTTFVPTANQWRLETVALGAYQSYSNVMIKFRHTTDYENQLYIDDINIQNTTGVESTMLANEINLFPNPSTGIVNLDVNLLSRDNLVINVNNAIGQRVTQVSDNNTYGGRYTLDLSNEPNGVYFIEVQTGTEVVTRRIVISH
ncbi:MAG TPA: T9SS type A sorting domain-containing protein, partial [Bacteroidia bacterium]|nr:T9SS type A sorting domain-containing protein [Bacteroidia bacterium]